MTNNEKLISYFKNLEDLTEDQWIDLDIKFNELVHNEKKNSSLNDLIEKSKKELNDQERYSFEASLHRSCTNLFLYNSKTQGEERLSLYLIPVSLVMNDGANLNKKIDSFFENYIDIEKVLKRHKLIHKTSSATILPNWISFEQLENATVSEISNFLKNFIETQDLMSAKLNNKFKYSEGEQLYIPLLITEDVCLDSVFIDNYDECDYNIMALIAEEISDALSSEDILLIPERISEFHEALSTIKSLVFCDEVLYHLEEVRSLKAPVKYCYLIKENDKITFSATTEANEELYQISIPSNSERILTEILENAKYQLVVENQVRPLEEDNHLIKFNYIGNLS